MEAKIKLIIFINHKLYPQCLSFFLSTYIEGLILDQIINTGNSMKTTIIAVRLV